MNKLFAAAILAASVLVYQPSSVGATGFACANFTALRSADAGSLEPALEEINAILTPAERLELQLTITASPHFSTTVYDQDTFASSFDACGWWPNDIAAAIWERNCERKGLVYSGDHKGTCKPKGK